MLSVQSEACAGKVLHYTGDSRVEVTVEADGHVPARRQTREPTFLPAWRAGPTAERFDREGYDPGTESPFLPADRLPLSTFAIDVDTAAYANVRRFIVDRLRPVDRVSIVVYAGAADLVLPPTSGAERRRILEALDGLSARGSTAGAAGLRLAYEVARYAFAETGNNRVILATDGDFNVGESSDDFRFSTAVAELGLLLLDSPHRGKASWDGVVARARGALGRDAEGYRHDFVRLAEKAQLVAETMARAR